MGEPDWSGRGGRGLRFSNIDDPSLEGSSSLSGYLGRWHRGNVDNPGCQISGGGIAPVEALSRMRNEGQLLPQLFPQWGFAIKHDFQRAVIAARPFHSRPALTATSR